MLLSAFCRRRLSTFCPRELGGELRDAFREVPLAYDGVAVEHGPRQVAREHHRHSLRDAGPDQVPGCASTEVVYDVTREPCLGPRIPPGGVVAPDRLPISMEHIRNDALQCALNRRRALSLRFEQCLKPRKGAEWERPPLPVLRSARLQPHHARGEVHLGPGQGEYLLLPPACEVREL